MLEQESKLVALVAPAPVAKPGPTPNAGPGVDPMTVTPGSLAFNADGGDGTTITDAQVSAPALEAGKRGLWALEKADLFNLLCVPPYALSSGDVGAQTRSAAAVYCKHRRAMYLVDPLEAWDEALGHLDVAASAGIRCPFRVTSMRTGAAPGSKSHVSCRTIW